MAKTIENMEKFVDEREMYFEENVFPITNKIAMAILKSRKLTRAEWKNHKGVQCNLSYNGVHIYFDNYISYTSLYYMTIKYGMFGFRKVLEYKTDAFCKPVNIFHEGEWIEKLNGLAEKIRKEDVDWREKHALKKYKKICKNYKIDDIQ